MPHADAALFPQEASREDAYEMLTEQLGGLLADQRNWVSNLSNAASLLWAFFHSRPSTEPLTRVNWAGFYVRSDLFPSPAARTTTSSTTTSASSSEQQPAVELLLGPFAGLPACQSIALPGSNSKRLPGVCAAAYLENTTQLVPDVEKRPGHIACDARTQSEIVVPVRRIRGGAGAGTETSVHAEVVGVLDIDCELASGFDDVDRQALERIADLIGRSCDW